jgi:hypothetical protein
MALPGQLEDMAVVPCLLKAEPRNKSLIMSPSEEQPGSCEMYRPNLKIELNRAGPLDLTIGGRFYF